MSLCAQSLHQRSGKVLPQHKLGKIVNLCKNDLPKYIDFGTQSWKIILKVSSILYITKPLGLTLHRTSVCLCDDVKYLFETVIYIYIPNFIQ